MEIKFLYNKRNKFIVYITLTLIFLSILVFLLVYSVTYNLNASKNNLNFVNKNEYEKSYKSNIKEVVLVGENSEGGYSEKSRIKLEISDINKVFTDMYPMDNYEIVDFNDDSIILREINKQGFDPNMYYIGQKNGYITVFKSDDSGNLFIENEKTDISTKSVNSLPIADRDLVMNYELKSTEKEEIQEILSELET